MSNKCIIIDCNAIEPGNTLLYGFPKDNRMKEKWSQAILNETGQNLFSENDVICSKHFSSNSFTTAESQDEIMLKPNAVPFTNDDEPFTKRIKIESEHVGNSEENQNGICINTAKENLIRSDNETLAISISNGDTGNDDDDTDFNNSDLNDDSDNSEDDDDDDNDSTYRPEIDWIQQQMQEQKVYFKEISDALKDVAQNLKEQSKMMQRSLELRQKQVEMIQKDFEEKQKYRKERLRLMQEEVNIERASLQLRLRQTINVEEVEEDVEE